MNKMTEDLVKRLKNYIEGLKQFEERKDSISIQDPALRNFHDGIYEGYANARKLLENTFPELSDNLRVQGGKAQ